jgi:ribosomal protein S18 acetylase RimI-like enzyme
MGLLRGGKTGEELSRCGPMTVTVSVAEAVTDELVAAFAVLIPQLSRSNPAPDAATLQALIDHEACHVLMARDDATGAYIGTTTLVVFPIPTAVRAWIEDVVVDSNTRGSGAGAALTNHAVALARSLGAKTVDLTSRPSREAANRLYQRLGFELRETNCYRFDL